MLAVFLVSLVLFTVGVAVIVKVTMVAMRRLGLEPTEVLEWLGLAEDPVDEHAVRRVRVVRPVGAS